MLRLFPYERTAAISALLKFATKTPYAERYAKEAREALLNIPGVCIERDRALAILDASYGLPARLVWGEN